MEDKGSNIQHIYLISDSTCYTVQTVAESCISQFRDCGIQFKTKLWPMVRTQEALNKVLDAIKLSPGMIIFTLSDFGLRNSVRNFAQDNKLPATSPIAEVVRNISRYYDLPLPNAVPGSHLELNEDYFKKIDSVQYTQSHDDGFNLDTISKADIIIIGVSRTSKSPTSFYLAHRGFNVANIPYYHRVEFPIAPSKYKNSLIVGLTINPEVLALIRKERGQRDMGENASNTSLTLHKYTDCDEIYLEVKNCLRFFTKHNIPYIDVTKKAIEETASEIIQLYTERFEVL